MTFASTIGLLAALTFPETEPLDPNLDWYDCSESFALEGGVTSTAAALANVVNVSGAVRLHDGLNC